MTSYAEASLTVTHLLHEMGVPPNFKGYNYLRDAVLMALQRSAAPRGRLDQAALSPTGRKVRLDAREASKRRSETPSSPVTSGGIRSLSTSCAERGAAESCPTNSMVIAKLADHIRLQKKVG